MNKKVVIGLLVVVAAVGSFLAYQNYKLKKQVEALSSQKETVSIKPVIPETKPANPAETSPFDKPNVDPLADKMLPPDSPDPKTVTTIRFEKTVHDFGKVNEGDLVRTIFKFTNTGKFPLMISQAQASCGCTVPQWPREPVQPGQSGEIAVQFDTHDKQGYVDKTVTVKANTHPASTVLTIKSLIAPKDK